MGGIQDHASPQEKSLLLAHYLSISFSDFLAFRNQSGWTNQAYQHNQAGSVSAHGELSPMWSYSALTYSSDGF